MGGRVGAGPAQAVDAGLDGAGRDRRPAGLELAGDGGAAAGRPAPRRPCRSAGRLPERRRRLDAELAPQGVLADRHLPEGGRPVARRGQAADQQLVVALVERVAGHRPRRVRDRVTGLPRGQQPQRRLPQPRLGRGRQPVALHDQPRLEGRAGQDADAVEQLAVQVEQARRVGQLPGEGMDVGRDAVPEGGRHRVAAEQLRRAELAPQLGQGPPQGPERVVRLVEQQLGQVPAAGRPLGQQQVGQQGPRLATARRRRRHAVPLDGRRAEQADPHHGNPLLGDMVAHSARRPQRAGVRCSPHLRVATTSRYSDGIATDGPGSWSWSLARAVRSSNSRSRPASSSASKALRVGP